MSSGRAPPAASMVKANCDSFGDANYNGEPIFVDSETHIPLSDSDIAEINQALYQ